MFKALFLVVFVPVHTVVTFLLVARLYSAPSPGSADAILRVAGRIFMLPLLYPLVRFDPDGDRIPLWLQLVSWPLNSLIWGLVLLAAALMLRRLREKLMDGD